MEEEKINMTSISDNEMPQLTQESLSFLLKTAKWGKFLSILGFIITGLMIIAGIFMGFIIGMLPDDMLPVDMPISPRFLSVIYIIIAGIYVVPVIFLNSFCNNAIKAINFANTQNLTESFKSLRNLFVFVGISTIVILAFYTIVLILAGTAAFLSL